MHISIDVKHYNVVATVEADEIHTNGIGHRNIKSRNSLYTRASDGRTRFCWADLGLAASIEEDELWPVGWHRGVYIAGNCCETEPYTIRFLLISGPYGLGETDLTKPDLAENDLGESDLAEPDLAGNDLSEHHLAQPIGQVCQPALETRTGRRPKFPHRHRRVSGKLCQC
ncbi:hypothetical protein BC938DRAFT_474779 [Jimgerdemannia flammicorona]|uniref:Protein kinase domain-containing protein n=1 Tax=Jimgerdemannia flammicorona TaxID=994334 RepID=A0A433Q1L3_9FUNG|nr:hypothetical protein BC938DRAFT_474779 [Jimgerdemannia flammicorona]